MHMSKIPFVRNTGPSTFGARRCDHPSLAASARDYINRVESSETFHVPLETIEATLKAYAEGFFPMSDNDRLGFYSSDPRSVYFFDSFHVPRSLRRYYRRHSFDLKTDTAFLEVVRSCRQGRPEWISEFQVQLYAELYKRGHAHSIEAWKDGELAGGIFGTHFGAAFLAESMFHRVPNASNVCLVYLMEMLLRCGFHFCDIQYANEHTARFHPTDLSMKNFMKIFRAALKDTATF